jgi:hypothetical protein
VKPTVASGAAPMPKESRTPMMARKS